MASQPVIQRESAQSHLKHQRTQAALRAQYIQLTQELQENKDALTEPKNEALVSYLTQSQELFERVTSTRESALDASFLRDIAELGSIKAQRINPGIKDYNVSDFLKRLPTFVRQNTSQPDERASQGSQTQIETENLDWSKLSKFVVCRTTWAPSLDAMYGLIDAPEKPKTVHERTKRTRTEETRPLDGKDEANQVGKETTVRVKELHKILKAHSKQEPEGCHLYKLLFNPYSFGQTVENFFYFAFLVQGGLAGVKVDSSNEPIAYLTKPLSAEQHAERKQAILSIDFDSWQAIKTRLDICDCMIPHRDYSSESYNPTGSSSAVPPSSKRHKPSS